MLVSIPFIELANMAAVCVVLHPVLHNEIVKSHQTVGYVCVINISETVGYVGLSIFLRL